MGVAQQHWMWHPSNMATTTILPLSQQVLAWSVQALGYDEAHIPTGAEVSAGTLKSARRGRPIPRSWEGVVGVAGRAFGWSNGLPEELAASLLPALREWDRRVSEIQ